MEVANAGRERKINGLLAEGLPLFLFMLAVAQASDQPDYAAAGVRMASI
jgi:hypothetical protein